MRSREIWRSYCLTATNPNFSIPLMHICLLSEKFYRIWDMLKERSNNLALLLTSLQLYNKNLIHLNAYM